MSNPNENQSSQQESDYIGINENGELLVTDPELAESLEELSSEELEDIAGGLGAVKESVPNKNCGTNCGC